MKQAFPHKKKEAKCQQGSYSAVKRSIMLISILLLHLFGEQTRCRPILNIRGLVLYKLFGRRGCPYTKEASL